MCTALENWPALEAMFWRCSDRVSRSLVRVRRPARDQNSKKEERGLAHRDTSDFFFTFLAWGLVIGGLLPREGSPTGAQKSGPNLAQSPVQIGAPVRHTAAKMMLSRATDAARKALTQRRYASSDNLLKTMLYVRSPASGKGFTRAAVVAATRQRAHTTRKPTAVAAPIAARLFACDSQKSTQPLSPHVRNGPNTRRTTHDRSPAPRTNRP